MAQKLSQAEFAAILHPTEFSRFILALFAIGPFILIFLLLLYFLPFRMIVFVALLLFTLWFMVQIIVARMMGDMVLVTKHSFPEAYRAIVEAKHVFGYTGSVEAFVREEGTYNLFLLALFKRKFLILNSEILESGKEDETRFLIGRFIGSLRAKHQRSHWFSIILSVAEAPKFFHFLLMPYERSLQLSGDRLGLYFVDGNVSAGVHALFRATVGQELAERVDIGDFLEQENRTAGSFFRLLARIVSPFPPMTKRIGHLVYFGIDKYPHQTKTYFTTLSGRSKQSIRMNYETVKKRMSYWV